MTTDGNPILLIDDDTDDTFLIERALHSVAPTHPVVTFTSANDALAYLMEEHEKPFLILSEVRLPDMSGIELRQRIDANPKLKKRSIPFLLMSQPIPDDVVSQAYDLTVQGLFEKPNGNQELHDILKAIIDYWSNCIPPQQ